GPDEAAGSGERALRPQRRAGVSHGQRVVFQEDRCAVGRSLEDDQEFLIGAELRPTRPRRNPAPNMMAPTTSAPVASVAIAGNSRRVSPCRAKNDRTMTTVPNEIRMPPTPISIAAMPARICVLG